ncbi:MAG: preprotein translocase subunit SecE [Terracidiphilus sp.]
MGTKATIVKPEERGPARRRELGAGSKLVAGVTGTWNDFRNFLSDVRAEMRKVVTPSRKEVKATTTVVIVAVFLFGVYFFLVDGIFSVALTRLLSKLGAQ